MLASLKLACRMLCDLRSVHGLIRFYEAGYLVDTGWFKSFKTKQSIDHNGDPIPWLTYAANDFLAARLNSTMDVLEYGAGNSTRYLGPRVRTVTSIEHDGTWVKSLTPYLSANTKVVQVPLDIDGKYCRAGAALGELFDMILIDGRDRVNCVTTCLPLLQPDGVIILDDSHREKYQTARAYLDTNGFRSIDFTGIGPGTIHRKATSVYYRANNCFGI